MVGASLRAPLPPPCNQFIYLLIYFCMAVGACSHEDLPYHTPPLHHLQWLPLPHRLHIVQPWGLCCTLSP